MRFGMWGAIIVLYRLNIANKVIFKCLEANVMTEQLAINLYGTGTTPSQAIDSLRDDVKSKNRCYDAYGPGNCVFHSTDS